MMFLHAILAAFLAITPTLKLPGHFFVGPEVKIRVEATVPVDRDNREIGIEWEGDEDGYTSRQLDEYVDWTRHSFEIRLRPGQYTFRAVLKRAGGERKVSSEQTVEVYSATPQEG